MKNKREFNPFNISFLDVLAGALGAVIILFLIIPKIDIQDIEKLETLKALEAEISSIDSVLAVVKNSVPQEDYEALIEFSGKIQAAIQQLNKEVESLQSTVSIKTKENNTLRAEVIEKNKLIKVLEEKIQNSESLQAEINSLQSRISQLETERKNVPTVKNNQTPSTPVAKAKVTKQKVTPQNTIRDTTPDVASEAIGVNPPLAIRINWDNPKDHVRLYVNKKGTKLWCYYQPKRRMTPFGKWMKLPKRFNSSPYEAIVQDKELIPGEYEIYAHVDKVDSLNHVEITGQITMNIKNKPFLNYPINSKVNKGGTPIRGDRQGYLGTLTVEADNIFWQESEAETVLQ